MIIMFFKLFFSYFKKFGHFLTYVTMDYILFFFRRSYKLFNGWGIHLYTGAFGQGKSMLMCIDAFKICKKKKQVTVLTNLQLTNFPSHTRVLQLNTAQDILNAPKNCIVLIDEIGTIFNSRDFSGSKSAVPKPLFQLLCQCRKRRLQIFGTVQRFNLLDKQIRDITATVTECSVSFRHPFSRLVTGRVYDIEDYEWYQANRLTAKKPVPINIKVEVQTTLFRKLYDTSDIVAGFLKKEFLSDSEILANQCSPEVLQGGEISVRSKKKSRFRK